MNYKKQYIDYKKKYLNLKKQVVSDLNKKKINNQMIGGGFQDDISILRSYAIYGHGSLPRNRTTFME